MLGYAHAGVSRMAVPDRAGIVWVSVHSERERHVHPPPILHEINDLT